MNASSLGRTFSFAVGLTIALFAVASDANAGRASLSQGRASVPMEIVTVMVMREGEDQDTFLRRAGGVMAGYTDRKGFEACASVCSAGNRLGVFITTSEAHAYCGVSTQCPGGFTPTGKNMHSHPQNTTYTVNETDAAFSNFRDRKGARKNIQPEQFSDHDYKAGAGYLATAGQLLYQEGRGSNRVVGELIAPPEEVLSSIVGPAQEVASAD